MEAGKRIVNLKREWNVKCGISKKDDSLNSRFYTPLEKGGTRKNVPPLDDLLSDYYEFRNWDAEGKPIN